MGNGLCRCARTKRSALRREQRPRRVATRNGNGRGRRLAVQRSLARRHASFPSETGGTRNLSFPPKNVKRIHARVARQERIRPGEGEVGCPAQRPAGKGTNRLSLRPCVAEGFASGNRRRKPNAPARCCRPWCLPVRRPTRCLLLRPCSFGSARGLRRPRGAPRLRVGGRSTHAPTNRQTKPPAAWRCRLRKTARGSMRRFFSRFGGG